MTMQETYERIIALMILQGNPATVLDPSAGIVCRYNTKDGDQCAVGCLLPAGLLPEGTSSRVTALPRWVLRRLGADGADDGYGMLTLLARLQRAHDSYITSKHWLRSFLASAVSIGECTKLDTSFAVEAHRESELYS